MKKPSFLNRERPLIISMLQARDPERVEELMRLSLADGAEGFGMQFCRMLEEHKSPDTYKRLFAAADGFPVYVTNYRDGENSEKSDDTLGRELIELAECGATLCDVMGDMYDANEDQLTMDGNAIEKQMKLIEDIHKAGAEVLMSSHVMRFIPAHRVLEIALEQQRRGADICKIVVGADSMEEQIENLRIARLLKENLSIPFLFLSGGESRILRRFGGELGCCMYLCVHEHDDLATPAQPLISCVKEIRDNN